MGNCLVCQGVGLCDGRGWCDETLEKGEGEHETLVSHEV